MLAKSFAIGAVLALLSTNGNAQTASPQEVLNQLIQRQQIEDQQRFEDRQRERLRKQQEPDFSVCGVPAPSQPQAPHRSLGCVGFGDGMGGGIVDCD
jgi:hypothetical protein